MEQLVGGITKLAQCIEILNETRQGDHAQVVGTADLTARIVTILEEQRQAVSPDQIGEPYHR